MPSLAASALGEDSIVSMESNGFAYVGHDAEENLKSVGKLVRDVDTFTSGHILAFEMPDEAGAAYVHEVELDTFKPVVRKLAAEDVDAFFEDRRLEYANMWGACCGGKVNAGERWIKGAAKEYEA